jgi:hypothetical protein
VATDSSPLEDNVAADENADAETSASPGESSVNEDNAPIVGDSNSVPPESDIQDNVVQGSTENAPIDGDGNSAPPESGTLDNMVQENNDVVESRESVVVQANIPEENIASGDTAQENHEAESTEPEGSIGMEATDIPLGNAADNENTAAEPIAVMNEASYSTNDDPPASTDPPEAETYASSAADNPSDKDESTLVSDPPVGIELLEDSNSAIETDPANGNEPAIDNDPVARNEPAIDNEPGAGSDPVMENDPATGSDHAIENNLTTGIDSEKDNDPSAGPDPAVENDTATGCDPAIDNDPSAGQDPAVENYTATGCDPAIDNDPSAGQDPAVENYTATGCDPAIDNDPADGSSPTLNNDPAIGRDSAVENDPLAGSDPARDNDYAMGSDPGIGNDPVIKSDPAMDNVPSTGSDLENETAASSDPAVKNDPVAGSDPEKDNESATGSDPAVNNNTTVANEPPFAGDPNDLALAIDSANTDCLGASDPVISSDLSRAIDSADDNAIVPPEGVTNQETGIVPATNEIPPAEANVVDQEQKNCDDASEQEKLSQGLEEGDITNAVAVSADHSSKEAGTGRQYTLHHFSVL